MHLRDSPVRGPQEQLPRATLSVDSKRQVHNASSLQAAALRRQRRRNLGAARELMYLFDGDHEGVCYHFGTDMGTKQWVNPVLTGRLQVLHSYLSGGFQLVCLDLSIWHFWPPRGMPRLCLQHHQCCLQIVDP